MKKTIALLALLCLCLLSACGGSADAGNAGQPQSPSQPVAESPEMSETPSEEPSADPDETPEAPSEEPSASPDEIPEASAAPEADQFALDQSDFTLFSAGSTWQLTYTADPVYKERPVFASSDERVVTVDENGVVTAVAPGKAVITATYGKTGEASCIVRCRWEENSGKENETAGAQPAEGTDLTAFAAGLLARYDCFDSHILADAEMTEAFYAGLSAADAKQLLVYVPQLSMNMGELVLVEVRESGDVAAVKAILQARIDYMAGDGESQGGAWYPMAMECWANESRVVSSGNYVMMVVGESCDDIVSDFNALF